MNRLRRTVGAAALLLAAGSAWAVSPGPSFYNLYDFNAEYALDRLSNAWDPDDRADFRAVGTGLRVTGGSLNIRHLQVREDIKLRVPFGARWTARFRRERDLGLSGKEGAPGPGPPGGSPPGVGPPPPRGSVCSRVHSLAGF
ncbi:MAG: hypothetical protein IPJ35_10210 [Elusimicrobia bacterium]|nr:hypothetical protein [Elusimicrobiota bacterium]